MAMPIDTAPGPVPVPGPRPEEPAEAVGPLLRGIAALRSLTEAGGGQDLPELARELDLARSSLDRVVATLTQLGFVQPRRRHVVLAPRLMRLGNAYLRASGMPELLGPSAERLSDQLDEVVTLTITHGGGEYLVHETSRPRKLTLSCRVGDRLPLEHCAGGALLAATWDEEHWESFRNSHTCADTAQSPNSCVDRLRERAADAARLGYVLDDQWLEPGLIAVSMPARRPDGSLACNANVLSFTSRHPTAGELAETALPALKNCVEAMEQSLRDDPSHPRPDTTEPAAVRIADAPGGLAAMARGFGVLDAFVHGPRDLTIADVARTTGLARATVRRALITLEHLGLVAQRAGRYRLTAGMLDLGFPVLSRMTLAQITQPHLEALSTRTGRSASLAILRDDTEIMYAARAATPARLTTIALHVGSLLPAHATAMGRVLLAALPEDRRTAALNAAPLAPLTPHTVTDHAELLDILRRVRETGHAIVDQELEAGLRSISVPVHGHDGRTLAAINLAMHAERGTSPSAAAAHLPDLRETADAIHQDLLETGRFTRLQPL